MSSSPVSRSRPFEIYEMPRSRRRRRVRRLALVVALIALLTLAATAAFLGAQFVRVPEPLFPLTTTLR